MVTYSISSEAVAVMISKAQEQDIRRTVSQCLRENGLAVWEDFEAEVYDAKNGCLLIARPRSPLLCRGAYRRRRRP